MGKHEFGVITKHIFLRGKIIKEIEEKFVKYYGMSVPSRGMVHKWSIEFRCVRTSTNDAERPGRSKEVTPQEMIDEIHDIVLKDRRLKIREISDICEDFD